MRFSLTAALGLALSLAAAAQTPVDVARLGPQAGERGAGLLAARPGRRRPTLRSLLGPKGAMLVFSRSADW